MIFQGPKDVGGGEIQYLPQEKVKFCYKIKKIQKISILLELLQIPCTDLSTVPYT